MRKKENMKKSLSLKDEESLSLSYFVFVCRQMSRLHCIYQCILLTTSSGWINSCGSFCSCPWLNYYLSKSMKKIFIRLIYLLPCHFAIFFQLFFSLFKVTDCRLCFHYFFINSFVLVTFFPFLLYLPVINWMTLFFLLFLFTFQSICRIFVNLSQFTTNFIVSQSIFILIKRCQCSGHWKYTTLRLF